MMGISEEIAREEILVSLIRARTLVFATILRILNLNVLVRQATGWFVLQIVFSTKLALR